MTLCFTYIKVWPVWRPSSWFFFFFFKVNSKKLMTRYTGMEWSAYVKHSATTYESKCNFSCYSSTFTILSTLFSLKSLVSTTIYIYIYVWRGAHIRPSGCGVTAFPSWFSTTFHKVEVEVMTSELPQVCKLWLWVSKDMLPVKHIAPKILRIMAINYCGQLLDRRLGGRHLLTITSKV